MYQPVEIDTLWRQRLLRRDCSRRAGRRVRIRRVVTHDAVFHVVSQRPMQGELVMALVTVALHYHSAPRRDRGPVHRKIADRIGGDAVFYTLLVRLAG